MLYVIQLFTTITVDEPAPGLKTILSFRVPDQSSGRVRNSMSLISLKLILFIDCWWLILFFMIVAQVELQYLHDYVGISSSIGLTANPVVNFSGVVGTNVASLGADLSFDSKSGNFTKCNAGLSFTNADLIASLTL